MGIELSSLKLNIEPQMKYAIFCHFYDISITAAIEYMRIPKRYIDMWYSLSRTITYSSILITGIQVYSKLTEVFPTLAYTLGLTFESDPYSNQIIFVKFSRKWDGHLAIKFKSGK